MSFGGVLLLPALSEINLLELRGSVRITLLQSLGCLDG